MYIPKPISDGMRINAANVHTCVDDNALRIGVQYLYPNGSDPTTACDGVLWQFFERTVTADEGKRLL